MYLQLFSVFQFPLLSKSPHLQKLISTSTDETDEINLHDIPGGPAAFELCAKFCYGMITTLNAYNVVPVRCAAEYLEMHESFEKGNLAHKIDVFLASGIFRSWKDSIIVLRATKSLLPWSEDLKIINRCVDSVASKASVDPSRVDWSYTYNRKKENRNEPLWNGVKKQQMVPIDWWVEDLCEVPVDLYKQVITAIQAKGRISADIIGESLKTYALKRLPDFHIQGNYLNKYRNLVETITWLIPAEKNCIPSGFLLKLLQASCLLGCEETGRGMLMVKISEQLEEVTLSDLLTRSENGDVALYNIDLVQSLLEQFLVQECGPRTEDPEFQVMYSGFGPDSSKSKVARLVDGYLAEAARDPSLQLSRFLDLANMVSGFPRLTHDGIYRAIDMYLKEHPGMSKGEKKKICRLMDCRKLSADACSHAVQNERLPLRMVVQVLFFEQSRASGNNLPAGLPGPMRSLLPGGSHGSSRSGTTYTDEDRTSSEMKALRGELASLRLRKDRQGENSSSDTSESPGSTLE